MAMFLKKPYEAGENHPQHDPNEELWTEKALAIAAVCKGKLKGRLKDSCATSLWKAKGQRKESNMQAKGDN